MKRLSFSIEIIQNKLELSQMLGKKTGKNSLGKFIESSKKYEVQLVVVLTHSIDKKTSIRIINFLDEKTVPYLSTSDKTGYSWEEKYIRNYKLKNDPHPNEKGHKIIGETIYKYLKTNDTFN